MPDSGLGFVAAYAFDDQWSIRGSISDANAAVDKIDPFKSGSEFFSFVQLDWQPTIKSRFTHNAHITLWRVDERKDAGVPESQGVTFGANWTFNEKTMPFIRAGWSEGGAPLMNKIVTLGVIQRFHRSDLMGIGFNWGDPSNKALRHQYTTELFYRWQMAENIAITPSVQWLHDPALNTEKDDLWVFGMRVRFSL